MKVRKLLVVGMLSAFAFTSCKNDAREQEGEDIELNADREADLNVDEQRLERERNSISARIQENQDLSTFSENMNRNGITANMRQDQTITQNGQANTQGQTATGQSEDNTNDQQLGQAHTTGGQIGTEAPLSEQGTYTIFAPSNTAYEGLTINERNQMNSNTPENRNRNLASLNYLMVEENLTEDRLRQQIQNSNGSYAITTMQGEEIIATLEGNQIILKDGSGNTARITNTDETASDGVVHVIDKVLRPKDLTKNAAANRMNNNTSAGGTTGGAGNTGTGE